MLISSLTTCLGRAVLVLKIKDNQRRCKLASVFSYGNIRLPRNDNLFILATLNDGSKDFTVGLTRHSADNVLDELIESAVRLEDFALGIDSHFESHAKKHIAYRSGENWVNRRLSIDLAVVLRLLVGEPRHLEGNPIPKWALTHGNSETLVSSFNLVVISFNKSC